MRGIRESARTNNIMVLIKLVAILAFIFARRLHFIHPANYHPFSPNGWAGVLAGGSIIFFTYIGFDSVSTASEECRDAQRTVPIGIIATLIVCTILYIGVRCVLTGIVPWRSVIGDAAPVVNGLKRLTLQTHSNLLHWTRLVVLLGAIIGMISSILVFQLGQARVWFAMSRDRLLPGLSHVHPRFRTPAFATWVAGFLVAFRPGCLMWARSPSSPTSARSLRSCSSPSAFSSCAERSRNGIVPSAYPAAQPSRCSASLFCVAADGGTAR